MSTVVTDGDYPARVAFSLLSRATEEFMKLHSSTFASAMADTALPIPGIEAMITKYQDPTKADPISRVEKDLEDTKQAFITLWLSGKQAR